MPIGWNDRRLWCALVLAVVLRTAFLIYLQAFHPDTFITNDSPDYFKPARGLLETGSFAVEGQPEIQRTPGYPLFLVPFLALFGDHWIPAVVVGHFFLTAGTAYLTYRLVQITPFCGIPSWAPALAFVLVLFEPNLFLLEFSIGTETLFVFLLTLGIYLLTRGLRYDRWPPAVAGIAAVTAAAFVRPIAVYLPYLLLVVVLSIYLIWPSGRRNRWAMIVAVCGAVLFHHAAVSAWESRNEGHYGVPVFSTIAKHNLYEYIGAAVLARAEGRGWQTVRREFQEREEGWDLNPAERAERAGDIGLDIVLDHPVEAAAIGARGLAVTLLDPGTGQLANTLELREEGSGLIYKFNNLSPPRFAVYLVKEEKALLAFLGGGLVWIVLLWGGAGWGLWLHRRSAGVVTVLLLGTAAYLLVLSAGSQSMARFRAPATPFILVFTAAGLSHAARRLNRRFKDRRKEARPAGREGGGGGG